MFWGKEGRLGCLCALFPIAGQPLYLALFSSFCLSVLQKAQCFFSPCKTAGFQGGENKKVTL